MRRTALLLVALAGVMPGSVGGGQSATPRPPTAADSQFFERKVRPLLFERCQGCHSARAGKRRGSLLLDAQAGILAGGDSGPAVVPGRPEESLLIRAVRYQG